MKNKIIDAFKIFGVNRDVVKAVYEIERITTEVMQIDKSWTVEEFEELVHNYCKEHIENMVESARYFREEVYQGISLQANNELAIKELQSIIRRMETWKVV